MKDIILITENIKKQGTLHGNSEDLVFENVGELVKTQRIGVSYTANFIDGGFTVNYAISGVIKAICARCLEEFEFPINLSDVKFYPVETQEINVSEQLREDIILFVPQNTLCKNDCLGLCQVCGASKNKESCTCNNNKPIDTRWSKLKDLLK